ncbi:MAG: cytochrome c biogenesis protein CcdA [Mucinivorans sp.]
MKLNLKSIIASVLLLVSTGAYAQLDNPVVWSAKVKDNVARFTAQIQTPWHMYDLGPYTDGPNATTFSFKLPSGVKTDGGVKTITRAKKVQDPMFGMEIGFFSSSAVFEQKFINTTGKAAKVVATVEWQVCDDQSCLPPDDFDMTITVEPMQATTAAVVTTPAVPTTPAQTVTAAAAEPAIDSAALVVEPVATEVEAEVQTTVAEDSLIKDEQKSIWSILIEAILWGFAALLTPCVFPMVPMTVSFFMKGSGSKARGRFMAMVYGISIILLYTLPIAIIIAITYFGGGESVTADIFNWLATHWVPNLLFFLIFMTFAASFFGAFEITMPSKLVNKSDAQADRGGLVGVFFMAMTLVLVSFSCTGPIVGTILVKSTQGAIWEPIVTMMVFSTAFALPFTVFALFPSLLKNLPKSGGWLNSVKVVLGFIELALGLKFLSVADQTYHWGLLDREVYLGLWIVIFSLLGLYLLGKLRFANDDKMEHVSVKRLFMAIFAFAFVVYMIPGMWGAPLKALSGYLPPVSTMDFDLTKNSSSASPASVGSLDLSKIKGGKPRFSDMLHLPHGLEGFFDFDEGVEYAKAVGKPIFLDFTGHGCVNCREMEANVWSDPVVLKILSEKYVIIALYVDDKKELPENQWIVDKKGKTQKTIGKINAAWQIERFGTNAQPYYCLLNPTTDKLLVSPRAYSLDVAAFVKFLESGVAAYEKQKQ